MGKGFSDDQSDLLREDGWDIELFYRENFRSFCVYAYKYTRDMAKAQDIVGNCFLQLAKLNKRFVSQREAAAYVMVSIRNSAINEYQNEQTNERLKKELSLQPAPDNDGSAELFKVELLALLYELIGLLPVQRQEVMRLLAAGKTTKAIAEQLSLREQTVRNIKSQAIAQLKKLVDKRHLLLLAAVALFQ